MEQQIQRWALGVAGAGFVVVWTALGLETAVLALAGALLAANHHLLLGITRRRRQQAVSSRQRRATRARPLREEDDALPLVPDEPSLILDAGGF